MAPGLIEPTAEFIQPSAAAKSIFPDGLRTSGQQEPAYSLIQPSEKFPGEFTGPTVWTAAESGSNPENWTYAITGIEISEIGAAADGFIQLGRPLTGISKLWGLQKSATAYMGPGTHLGYFTSQNSRGNVLGHVKDLGEDPTQTDKVRIYRTNARRYFHADAADLVGLPCISRSMEGGESEIVSMHHVFNCLQREHPDVARTLYAQIPPLSEAQIHAMKVLEKSCMRESLQMILAPGDIQSLSDSQTSHARAAYKDYAPGTVDENGNPRSRRHLMRLWLSVPIEEGGWKLPYLNANLKKRGGIQVNNTPPTCPLDAE